MDDEILVKDEPLASKMRPECLEDIVGQEHILGKGKLLYRAIMADKLGSIILYGPPGTGKTSIASVIAKTTNSQFRKINATTSGKKDMEEIIEDAKDDLYMYGKKTILFIDEIHRFNKAQQDYLLPFIEKGIITLIGATTENPFFEINKAILSRSQVFELQQLDQKAIQKIILKAISDKKNGYGNLKINLDQEALEFLSNCSVGDARTALNAIELAVKTTEKEDDVIHITIDVIQDCIQKKIVKYDNNDNHYDTISAFIKSMRGSDPDAAVYYLGKMLYAGEDIKFIARRIMIDMLGAKDIDGKALRDRQKLANGGIVIISLTTDSEGNWFPNPAITSFGLSRSDISAKLFQDIRDELNRQMKKHPICTESEYKAMRNRFNHVIEVFIHAKTGLETIVFTTINEATKN